MSASHPPSVGSARAGHRQSHEERNCLARLVFVETLARDAAGNPAAHAGPPRMMKPSTGIHLVMRERESRRDRSCACARGIRARELFPTRPDRLIGDHRHNARIFIGSSFQVFTRARSRRRCRRSACPARLSPSTSRPPGAQHTLFRCAHGRRWRRACSGH
jgi:hypothetical protein